MLPDATLQIYLTGLEPQQADSVVAIRNLILNCCPDLDEQIDEGKWFGGLLTYSSNDSIFIFALGPRAGGFTTLHMMPYYGSSILRERHEKVLKKFLTGKSCIRFLHAHDLTTEAIVDIFQSTSKFLEMARRFTKRKR